MSKIIPQEHKDGMVDLYLSGENLKNSALHFGYSVTACVGELRRRGIPTRTVSEAARKYKLDETFFDEINSEEKAYWLGFLTADGCIDKYSVRIVLHRKDKDHLSKFTEALKSSHPVYEYNITQNDHICQYCGVGINSKKLSSSIQKLGVVPKKSLIVKPYNVSPEFARHYWRGLIDGDGSLHVNPIGSNPKYRVSLVGSKFIVEGFSTWVKSFTESRANVRPHKSIWEIKYGGTFLPSLISKMLYDNSLVYLDRKMELAQQIMAVV